MPNAYRLRVAPNRIDVTQSHGGTAETEAAVKAALKWLADNQAADGRWDPRTHEAGKETNVLGRDRQGAGSRADTAMTGLALLELSRLRPYPSRRPVSRRRPPRPGVPDADPSRRRQSRRQRRDVRVHVLPRDGHLCPERSLWNDPRRSRCASRSAGPSAIRWRPRIPRAAAGVISPATPATPANSAGN